MRGSDERYCRGRWLGLASQRASVAEDRHKQPERSNQLACNRESVPATMRRCLRSAAILLVLCLCAASSAAQQLESETALASESRALLHSDRYKAAAKAKRAAAKAKRAAAALRKRAAAEALLKLSAQERLAATALKAASLPNQVVCKAGDPGTRCFSDPCLGATCAHYPTGKCIPNYCRVPTSFLGITTGAACTAVFVDPVTQRGLKCDIPPVADTPPPPPTGAARVEATRLV